MSFHKDKTTKQTTISKENQINTKITAVLSLSILKKIIKINDKMEITFNSCDEIRKFLSNINYSKDNNDYKNAKFIDDSNGKIEERINEIYGCLQDSDLLIYMNGSEMQKRRIITENSGSILFFCEVIDSPSFCNFIMDKHPRLEIGCDLMDNPAITCIFSDFPENNRVFIERGFCDLLNIPVSISYGIHGEDELYPIHLLVGLRMYSDARLTTLKIMKTYCIDLNVVTPKNKETALIMFLNDLIYENKQLNDDDFETLLELKTEENLYMYDIRGEYPKMLFQKLILKESQKIRLNL